MNPNLKWKIIFIAAVILLCIYGLICLPTFPTSRADLKNNVTNRIKLGLDLQGGTYLILEVQVQEAVGLHTDQTVDRLTSQLRSPERNIRYDDIHRVDNTHILVRGIAPEQDGQFRQTVNDLFTSDWELSPAPGEPSGYVLTMRPNTVAGIESEAMNQSVETIRRRIDQLGLTEPIVAPYGRGDNQIMVQLPGESDPNRAMNVIKAGGQLELRLVVDPQPYSSQVAALSAHNGILPPGTEVLPGKGSASSAQNAGATSWYLVERTPIVTGRDLRSATPTRSTENIGYYQVNFTLSTEAGKRFGPFTEQNIGKPMAIILDHQVQSVAEIHGRIEDSGMIEGRFTQQDANDLALILRAGALPASIKYLQESTVGPSLGADSIRHGWQASVLSLVVVMVFMVFYYRLSGVNAVVALLLNLIILLAALAYFGGVLTLPGIAGVILTIGMGVDSNVLIFERIREEMRSGKAPVTAVDLGFKRAFLTIIDTHVTTVVSAFFLFVFGTGPVRGFAVTLTVGLVANIFTAVYVSRVIFDWHLAHMGRQAELSI